MARAVSATRRDPRRATALDWRFGLLVEGFTSRRGYRRRMTVLALLLGPFLQLMARRAHDAEVATCSRHPENRAPSCR